MDADVQKEINEIRTALQNVTIALQVLQSITLEKMENKADRKRLIDAMGELSRIAHVGGIRGFSR